MGKQNNDPESYISGCIQNRTMFRVLSLIDEIAESGGSDSAVGSWVRNNKKWFIHDLEWSATRVMYVSNEPSILVVTGPAGRVFVKINDILSEEEIDSSPNGPEKNGDIRDLQAIGGFAYAAGMGRQVYRREKNGTWSRQDTGVLQPPSKTEAFGFNSIHGITEDNIFAVGFGGEIWQRLNGKWKKITSPTNLILNCVVMKDEKTVYSCGQMGILLKGSGQNWKVIDHGITKDQFWSMAVFNDELYLATEFQIYKLINEDELIPIETGIKKSRSFGHLHSNDGVLLSTGTKLVCFTEDGKKWTDITP
jgi:hypothetical protein